MHLERANALIQILRDVQARDKKEGHSHFSIVRWADNLTLLKGVHCGTVACACGWMVLSDRGKADGLTLDTGELHYQGRENSQAAAAYFQISSGQARFLFSPLEYNDNPSINEVIARIEKVAQQRVRMVM